MHTCMAFSGEYLFVRGVRQDVEEGRVNCALGYLAYISIVFIAVYSIFSEEELLRRIH